MTPQGSSDREPTLFKITFKRVRGKTKHQLIKGFFLKSADVFFSGLFSQSTDSDMKTDSPGEGSCSIGVKKADDK